MAPWSELSAVLALALVVLQFQISNGAKILAVTTLVSPSHGIWNRVLIEALADKGHQITSLTPYPGKNRTGLRYLDIGGEFDDDNFVDFAYLGAKQHIDIFWEIMAEIDSMQIISPLVKDVLIEPKEEFELIIYESCASGVFAGAFGKIKAPVVAICAYAEASWNWDSMGVPNSPAVFPQALFNFRSQMSFWERVQNFVSVYYENYARSNFLKKQQAHARHVFGKKAADLRDVEENFALLLMNSGPSGIERGRSLPPNVKEVGCLHCKPATGANIPQDVKEFLDSANDGFVYFSLGSNVKSQHLPKEVLEGIVKILGELEMKVLWKFEAEELPGKPDNVMINKWLPQPEVLAHKNIRLFITHGGRLSTQEAGFHGVPVLVIPFFSDQYVIGERMVELGVGLRLNYRDFDLATFKTMIRSILDNPKYMERAKEVSVIARDQPESALERAVFWTEYVIRHKGAKHLRPAGGHLNWFQRHSWDVIAFLLAGPILFLLILKKIVFSIVSTTQTKSKVKTG